MRQYIYKTLITAGSTVQTGSPELVQDFRNVDIALSSDDLLTSATVKFQVSKQPTLPDFSASPSTTNDWQYCQAKALIDGTTVNGNIGATVSGAGVRHYEINENAIFWVNVEITTITSGRVTARLLATDYAI